MTNFLLPFPTSMGLPFAITTFRRSLGRALQRSYRTTLKRRLTSAKWPLDSKDFCRTGDLRQNSKKARDTWIRLGYEMVSIPPRSPDFYLMWKKAEGRCQIFSVIIERMNLVLTHINLEDISNIIIIFDIFQIE